MTKKDMRLKINKQILGTATNRDTYQQRQQVVLSTNRPRKTEPQSPTGEK